MKLALLLLEAALRKIKKMKLIKSIRLLTNKYYNIWFKKSEAIQFNRKKVDLLFILILYYILIVYIMVYKKLKYNLI
jgi:hypothetical protein